MLFLVMRKREDSTISLAMQHLKAAEQAALADLISPGLIFLISLGIFLAICLAAAEAVAEAMVR